MAATAGCPECRDPPALEYSAFAKRRDPKGIAVAVTGYGAPHVPSAWSEVRYRMTCRACQRFGPWCDDQPDAQDAWNERFGDD